MKYLFSFSLLSLLMLSACGASVTPEADSGAISQVETGSEDTSTSSDIVTQVTTESGVTISITTVSGATGTGFTSDETESLRNEIFKN